MACDIAPWPQPLDGVGRVWKAHSCFVLPHPGAAPNPHCFAPQPRHKLPEEPAEFYRARGEEAGAKSTLRSGQQLLRMSKLVTASDKSLLHSFPDYFLLSWSVKERNSFLYANTLTDSVYLGLSLVQVLLQDGVFLLQVIPLACASFQRTFCCQQLSESIGELSLQLCHCSLGQQRHRSVKKEVRSQNLYFHCQLLVSSYTEITFLSASQSRLSTGRRWHLHS